MLWLVAIFGFAYSDFQASAVGSAGAPRIE
jgi:hypothetical protein